MSALVADTHTAVWYLLNDARLSLSAREALDAASAAGNPIFVSAISVVELFYLAEKGRVPLAALQRLRTALADPLSGFVVADVNLDVADAIAAIPREAVPDLPDRVIAATACALRVPLVTRDRQIRAASVETIW